MPVTPRRVTARTWVARPSCRSPPLQAARAVAQVDSNVVVTLGIDTLTITSVTLAGVADNFLFV